MTQPGVDALNRAMQLLNQAQDFIKSGKAQEFLASEKGQEITNKYGEQFSESIPPSASAVPHPASV